MATTISSTVFPTKLGSPPDFGTLYSGRALEFDGVVDYVLADALGIGTTDKCTFSAWVYPDGVSSYQSIMDNEEGSTNRIGLQIGSDEAIFCIHDGVGTATKSGVVAASRWYHLVGTLNNRSLELYIDGVVQTGQTWNATSSNTNYVPPIKMT